MSLTLTFNDEGANVLKKAQEALGFSSTEKTITFALTLLNFATAAKKQGRNIAVVQDTNGVLSGYSASVDVGFNLSETSGDKISTFRVKGSTFIAPPI